MPRREDVVRIFSDEDSRAKKGLMCLCGLLAALLVLVLVVGVLTPIERATRPERTADIAQEDPDRPEGPSARPSRAGAAAPDREIVPLPEENKADIARAMDLSNARQLVRMLMQAAGSGNDPLKQSMLRALGRYRNTARAVIEENLAQDTSPAVRTALEEALALCR